MTGRNEGDHQPVAKTWRDLFVMSDYSNCMIERMKGKPDNEGNAEDVNGYIDCIGVVCAVESKLFPDIEHRQHDGGQKLRDEC